MNNFRTVVSPAPAPIKMGLSDKIMTVGSCFSDVIGHRLAINKISALSNPFGTLYNPVAIHNVIGLAVKKDLPSPSGFVRHDEIFFHHDFHSDLSGLSQSTLEAQLKATIDQAHQFVAEAHWIIITYGTAWVHVRKDNGEQVANCHKVPQSSFQKKLLSAASILSSFDSLYTALRALNPIAKIILTVSPVRHLKDTLELNSLSKALLRAACHELTQAYQNVSYFPAFEIMMDDLRDYRFYKSDMIHPSELAEDYIWNKFVEAYADKSVRDFLDQWHQVITAMKHKPFHPNSSAHQQFLKDTLVKLEQFAQIVNVDADIIEMKKRINQSKADVS